MSKTVYPDLQNATNFPNLTFFIKLLGGCKGDELVSEIRLRPERNIDEDSISQWSNQQNERLQRRSFFLHSTTTCSSEPDSRTYTAFFNSMIILNCINN